MIEIVGNHENLGTEKNSLAIKICALTCYTKIDFLSEPLEEPCLALVIGFILAPEVPTYPK